MTAAKHIWVDEIQAEIDEKAKMHFIALGEAGAIPKEYSGWCVIIERPDGHRRLLVAQSETEPLVFASADGLIMLAQQVLPAGTELTFPLRADASCADDVWDLMAKNRPIRTPNPPRLVR